MYCQNCGQELLPTAKFCIDCGAPVSAQSPAPVKPIPVYKRWWFWVIIAVAVVALVGVSAGTKETAPVETIVAAQTEAPILPHVVTEAPAAEAPSASVSIDTALMLIDSVMKDNFKHYDISYEDEMVTIDVWDDGIAMGVTLAANGNKDFQNSWNTVVTNQLEFCDSVQTLLETLGLGNVSVFINILNDGNLDNVLLSVWNGVVLYNALTD